MKVDRFLMMIRKPLCLLIIAVVVFCYGFDSSAAETYFYEYFGVDPSEIRNFPDAYDYEMKTYATVHNLPSDFNNSLGYSRTSLKNDFGFGIVQYWNNFSSGNVSVDMTNFYTSITSTSGSGGVQNGMVERLQFSSNYFAVVDRYYVSDAPFKIYQNMFYTRTSDSAFWYQGPQQVFDINTPDSKGYYKFDWVYNYTGAFRLNLYMTDMPLYKSTTSGNSGFSSYDDFSFMADNVNYNIWFGDGLIVDPRPPAVVPTQSERYLNTSINANLSGSFPDALYCEYTFGFNNYMHLNKNQYKFNVEYDLNIGTNSSGVLSFEKSEIYNLADVLGTYDWFMRPIDLDSFSGANGFSDPMDFLEFLHAQITGTGSEYYDPGDWSYSGSNFDPIYGLTSDYSRATNKPLINGKLVGANKLTTANITIRCYLSTNNGIDDYNSGVYMYNYDFLDGSGQVLQNDSIVNLNPPDGGSLNITPYSGNNNNSSGGWLNQVFSPQFIIENMVGKDGGLYPYTMSYEDFGNLRDVFEYINTQYAEIGEPNNFIEVLRTAYSFIPQQLWHVIFVGVGCITAFATIRFVRNK